MNKERLLFITGYFPFAQGGAELQAYYLAQKCRDFAKVAFIYRNHAIKKKGKVADDGFLLYPINPVKVFLLRRTFFFEGAQLWKRGLMKFRPTIIYYRGMNAYLYFVAVHAKYYKSKLIIHIASDPDLLRPARVKKSPGYLLKRFCFNIAHAIIVQTEYQAHLLEKNFNRRAMVIPNGHPIPPGCFKKSNKEISILWIANWKPIKRPEMFVKLVEQMSNVENVRFIMVGRNEGYPNLIDRALRNGIEVMGEISNGRVNDLLAKSHLLVNTSRHEGFSNTFVQAWMRKVPVVSLSVDPDGIIEKRGLGLYSGSFTQLIKDIKSLISDSHRLQQIGENARKYATQYHSIDNFNRIRRIMNDSGAPRDRNT
ncbi:MAG: glycosyltransferase family 4 protein [Desulfobacter sp.]|nr:MAG: glycosyltransferase family 4 protein [Desulfobacter sp.]